MKILLRNAYFFYEIPDINVSSPDSEFKSHTINNAALLSDYYHKAPKVGGSFAYGYHPTYRNYLNLVYSIQEKQRRSPILVRIRKLGLLRVMFLKRVEFWQSLDRFGLLEMDKEDYQAC